MDAGRAARTGRVRRRLPVASAERVAMREFKGGDWVAKNIRYWRDWLSPFVGRACVYGLEMGAYEGRSACWWAENILTGPGSQLITVDVWWNHDELYQRCLANVAGLPVEGRRASTRRSVA